MVIDIKVDFLMVLKVEMVQPTSMMEVKYQGIGIMIILKV